MNILLFSKIIAHTGVGNHIKELSAELTRQGHRVIVVSSTNEMEVGKNDTENVKFYRVPVTTKNPIQALKNLKMLNSIIKAEKIDVVHCHHRMAALYMRAYKCINSIPVVYTLHLAPIPSDFIHRVFTYSGDKAIGVSTEVSEFLIDKLKVKAKKVTTVLNGVDNEKLLPLSDDEKKAIKEKYNISDDKTVLVMHSRIDRVKNHLFTVEIMSKLPQRIKDRVVVVCSGEKDGGYYQEVLEKIKEYDLEKNFVFTGWINTRDIMGVADLILLPSFKEGFPLTVIEAFFMNVPVLRTQSGGYRDQKIGCGCIYLNKPEELVEEITNLCEKGKEIYKEQIDRAYKFAIENVTIGKMVQNTVDVYKEVCR